MTCNLLTNRANVYSGFPSWLAKQSSLHTRTCHFPGLPYFKKNSAEVALLKAPLRLHGSHCPWPYDTSLDWCVALPISGMHGHAPWFCVATMVSARQKVTWLYICHRDRAQGELSWLWKVHPLGEMSTQEPAPQHGVWVIVQAESDHTSSPPPTAHRQRERGPQLGQTFYLGYFLPLIKALTRCVMNVSLTTPLSIKALGFHWPILLPLKSCWPKISLAPIYKPYRPSHLRKVLWPWLRKGLILVNTPEKTFGPASLNGQ